MNDHRAARTPAAKDDPGSPSRRRFLKLGAAVGGLAAAPLLGACGGGSASSGSLLAWTYDSQAKTTAAEFIRRHPGIGVTMEVFPGPAYETKLQLVLSVDQGAPDVFDMDADYLGKYMDAFAEDLTGYGAESLLAGYVPYVAALGRDAKGRIRGVTDTSSPAGFMYRRSLAREYLGVTSAAQLSAKLTQWANIIPLGREVRNRSRGKAHIIADYTDILQDVRHQMTPWVVNGKFTVDERWNEVLDIARTVYDEDLDAKLAAFSAPWGAAWNNGSVVMFGWPSWEVTAIDPSETGNDWGLARGPSPEYEGGRYAFIYKNSPKKKLAYEYLKFIASTEWQTYNLRQSQNMPGLKPVYAQNRNSYKPALFGGQPVMEIYEPIAMAIPARADNPGSEAVQKLFYTAVADGYQAGMANAKIFASLRAAVKDQLPDVHF